MSIAHNLKMIRARYSFTQEQFAELMEVSRSMINSYEQERALPSHKFIISLTKKTGLPSDLLMNGAIHMENLPSELNINGVTEPAERYQPQVNLYDIRNLVEEVKSIRDEIREMKKKIDP